MSRSEATRRRLTTSGAPPKGLAPLHLGDSENGRHALSASVVERSPLPTVALIETQGSAVHVLPAAAAALADWLHLFARPKAREELWGVDGIAQRCGVSRSTVYNWASKPGFPAPVPVVGGNGPVWEARAVKAWVKLARSKGGRPKKAARRS